MYKTKIGLLLVVVLIVFTGTVNAQKNYTIDADNAYRGEQYFSAVTLYKKAYVKESDRETKIRILFRIGQCYRFIQQPENAVSWYEKAIKAGYPDENLKLYLADVYKVQGKYDEAAEMYKEYQADGGNATLAKEGIRSCQLAKKWQESPEQLIVENVSEINSREYDFSPTVSGRRMDEMYFTSTRPSSFGSGIDPNIGESYSDIYYSKLGRNGRWSTPTPLPEPVNTDANEGSVTITGRDRILYFTLCPEENGEVLGCHIMKANKRGRDWGEVELVPVQKDDSITIGHPSANEEGDVVYFAGDLPGTKGGKDIWYMTYDARENVWSEPVNVESVNTDEDELFPHIRGNGDLYFASKGHAGMGGLDIFVAPSIGKNKFGEVQNLKAPINSPSNDFGIFFTKDDEDEGFFTSNRSGGKGGDDIYAFKAPPVIFVLQGTVRDVDCGDPVPNAAVKLIGTDGSTAETQTDASGQYRFEAKEDGSRFINKNTSYTVIVSKSSDQRRISPNCEENNIPQRAYLRGKAQETTVGIQKSTAFVKDFDLQCSNCGEIKFAKVLYPVNEWELLINNEVNSADSLNELYNTLVENPTLVIELQAHTDARGSVEANQKLSENRAKTCVEYLVEKGIDRERLEPKGMGENQPYMDPVSKIVYTEAYINSLPTKAEREAAHQINRRTVFEVLREDFVPKEENTGEEGGGDETPELESGDQ